MQADPITKTCPICWETFSPAGRQARHRIYCSKRCKSTAASRRERGEFVPHTRTTSSPAAPGTPTMPAPIEQLPQPAAHRECPHCGGPVTIVALLTTPEAARPQLPAAAPDGVIPFRR
ncbi:hypothetical protein GCM10022267_72260 [Lentzea roselyniae]|uniref:Uncharacterized protein n=1 Tax=Lentzea roselyniae TaxID=531940 RepID=A0ABP7C3C1_9PSEU